MRTLPALLISVASQHSHQTFKTCADSPGWQAAGGLLAGRAQEACGTDVRRGEEGRVGALSTRRNEANGPQPLAPEGLPRRGSACFVLAPRRCSGASTSSRRLALEAVASATRLTRAPRQPAHLLRRASRRGTLEVHQYDSVPRRSPSLNLTAVRSAAGFCESRKNRQGGLPLRELPGGTPPSPLPALFASATSWPAPGLESKEVSKRGG